MSGLGVVFLVFVEEVVELEQLPEELSELLAEVSGFVLTVSSDGLDVSHEACDVVVFSSHTSILNSLSREGRHAPPP